MTKQEIESENDVFGAFQFAMTTHDVCVLYLDSITNNIAINIPRIHEIYNLAKKINEVMLLFPFLLTTIFVASTKKKGSNLNYFRDTNSHFLATRTCYNKKLIDQQSIFS